MTAIAIVSRLLAVLLCFGLATGLASSPAAAVEPGEILADPVLETRARQLSAKLRCLVCQNQSIDDSNAPLAKDLRLLVRERLQAGDSDQAAMSYVVARYGDFVLLSPPFKASTILLWIAPLLGLAGIAYALLRSTGRFQAPLADGGAQHLTAAEEERLRALIKDPGEPNRQS